MCTDGCIIGIWNDYEDTKGVSYDDLVDLSKSSYNAFSMEQYLDRRCGTNLSRFTYCPYCGKKIDWKSLRKNI